MVNLILAISNHGIMLGGGEHSFFGLISRLPDNWQAISVMPCEGELAERFRNKKIETQILPLPAIRPWLIADIVDSVKSYFNVCKRHCPVMIYANGSRAALYGGVVGRILKLPVIWHCRIADPDVYLDFLLSKLSSLIVANSQATAHRFRPCVQPKVRIIYNGVDIEWLKDRTVKKPDFIQDDWKTMLTVARVSRWKRHDVVLSAFEHVAASDPKVHLVCLGSKDASEPEWWDHLQEKSRRSPFSSRIHWVGQVEDVRPWYRAAHMLILGSENEPFGRVLIEAMACGVPVVATRSGGVPEVVRHGEDGFLVVPGNVEEMAAAIVKILRDESLRERLVKSGRERANFFSLDAHVAKMVQIFENTLPKSV